jgi:CheY-like chemotaxis protein
MSKMTLRILVVDDESDTCEYMRDLLDDADQFRAVVDAVHNAEEGFAALKRGRYDILIVDYNLGAMTGLEMLTQLRVSGSLIPAIMMSGFGNKDLEKKARQAGAVDYISKNELSARVIERALLLAVRTEPERHRGNPDPSAVTGDLGLLLSEVINLNKQFVKATTDNTVEVRGMRSDITQGFGTLNLDIRKMTDSATQERDENSDRFMEQLKTSGEFMALTKQDVVEAVKGSNKPMALKVLDWIKDNRGLALGIAIAAVFFILLAVIVSQTINPATLNQLRDGSAATEVHP